MDSAAFSPDGTILVIGGGFPGKAKIYSVDGTTITYVSDIYANNNGTALNSYVESIAFSPDGKTLVLGGQFTGYAKVYSVSGTTITYISDIYADNNGTALSYRIWSVAFSPDGKTLVLGGQFDSKAKVYSVNGSAITFVSNIYANKGTTALNDSVSSVAFSPGGKLLVLSGSFTGYAKIYSVDGTNITFVRNIYADNNSTSLSRYGDSVSFSPDGKTLVLSGGYSNYYVKVYSVNDTTITYVSDIYADNNNTAFNHGIESIAFSPDGNTLILGGFFTGYAKVYSVNGTTITYVSDIYADDRATSLGDSVYIVAFFPNNNAVVLGGYFDSRGRVYFIDGSTVCYNATSYLAPNGNFTNLPLGSKLGFAKSSAEIGKEVTVKTIGTFAALAMSYAEEVKF